MKIHPALAQQIVDSAKAIVGWNVNFITPEGTIIASTDASRIGVYHGAGHKAAKTKAVQVVSYTGEYEGAVQGINYPIVMHHDVAGVMGITGEPEVVRKYGSLLTKICEVFLRENELEVQYFSEQQRVSRVVMALMYHDVDSIAGLLQNGDIDSSEQYIVVTAALESPGGEQPLIDAMRALGVSLYTSLYPQTLVFLLTKETYGAWRSQFLRWPSGLREGARFGIGTWEGPYYLHHSYRFSQLALQYGRRAGKGCVFAEELNVELLLASVDTQVKRQYKERVSGMLSPQDIALLREYYERNVSVQETADALHIHKNTLQYRLKRIHEKSGLDPKKFRDAVPLYIALKIDD